VDAATDLPEGAEDPRVRRDAWRDRVTDVVITGPVGAEQLGRYADELSLRLFAQGVTRTTIRGVAAPEVLVEVTTPDLMRHDVTMEEMARAVGEVASADPAGDVSGGAARVRTGVPRRSAEEVAGVVLRLGPDGTALTVGDVARVLRLGTDRERAYFVGGDPAVSMRIDRSEAGDAIELQERVEAAAAELAQGLPEGVRVDLIRTRSEYITGRIGILLDNAATGLVLVVALLFLFLNARTAFWVAAGIPVALLAAIALMWAGGLTINMISLFALIITLGIVVDDAIVVGEHADFRARQLGEAPQIAAERAAQRMFAPVFSATLTTVIAFWSLVVIGGRFGTLIADIPFTVIAVLLASLVECFLILPRHMAHAIDAPGAPRLSRRNLALALVLMPLAFGVAAAWAWSGGRPEWSSGAFWGVAGAVQAAAFLALLAAVRRPGVARALSGPWFDLPSRVVNRGFDRVRDGAFRPAMRLVVRARYPVLAAAVLALLASTAMIVRGDVAWRFFDAPEQGSVSGNFAMLEGASRQDAMDQLRELQHAAEAVSARYEEEHGRNPVTYAIAEIGGTAGFFGSDDRDADLLGAISLELIEADLRPYSSFEFADAVAEEVERHPMLETLSFRGWRSGPGGDSLSVELFGADAAVLKAAAEALKAEVAPMPAVSGVEDSLAYDKEELILELTPQGRALGFTADGLGSVLRARLDGIEAASFPVGQRSGTIRVEMAPSELTADFLDRMRLRTEAGTYVPLADLVAVQSRQGFSTVERRNGVAVVEVTGDVSEDDPAAAAEVTRALAEEILPGIEARFGTGYRLTGLAEQERAFLTDALIGFLLCLLAIYLVLAWIFASWTRPAVVMAVIPFGLVGTIFGHWWWEVPLSMFTVVGLIGMTGIVINDSIVLVTTIDEKARGRALIPAIVDGAADRLRPVLLTTLTTVLGLAPLLFESSQQAQFLKPTVITLVYGLAFGMVLVLLVVPALMAAQRDVGRAGRAARRALSGRAGAVSWAVRLQALGAAALGVATLGWTIATGALPGPLAGLGGPPLGTALALFAAGLLALTAALWAVGMVLAWRASRRGSRRGPARGAAGAA
jgi:multidrug efflux pump subunit AcrB